jgi:superfamily II DNA or RNA helicase
VPIVTADHLRPYQKRDYRDVLARCEKVRSVLYVAFMGSGKTVLAAAVIRTWVARSERTLILTHTREILRQTHDKLVAAGVAEEQIGWIWRAHARTNSEAPIQLASLDTLARRDLPQGITRIVVDEAHHATAKKWRNVLDAYPNARVLGLTGTPVRLDGQPLGSVFEEMIQSEPTESLIEQGWISRPSIWTPAWHVELSRSSGGDFSDLVAAEMMPHARVLESMVAEYTKHAAGLPALGFAATREKAIQYAAHFAASGIPADTLFGSDMDLKRQGTLARLRKGALRVLWTCNVLGEGWDYPGLRCVMLARPTLSIARYLQQVARCMRPGEAPVVLDLWGAFRVFDPPWADFGWRLDKRVRRSLHVGGRDDTGEVTWLPPVEVEGELVRADASVRTPCAVCGEPATRQSARHALSGKRKAYCGQHKGGSSAKLPLPKCAMCDEPATRMSANSARLSGGKSYCEKHKGGLNNPPPVLCAVCGKPATRKSAQSRRLHGWKAYCAKHKSGTFAPKPLLKCAMCNAPATRASTNSARSKMARDRLKGVRVRGPKAYCAKHKNGPSRLNPLFPCTICKKPATRSSSAGARYRGYKPYCAKHKKGRR